MIKMIYLLTYCSLSTRLTEKSRVSFIIHNYVD